MNNIIIDSNLTANLNCLTLRQKLELFNHLGFILDCLKNGDIDQKELVYYDTLLYMPIRSEILATNLQFAKCIDPLLISILTPSNKKVSYYCYDSRINSHRILLKTSLFNDTLPFGYLLITNLDDFKRSISELEQVMYG